MAPEQAQGDIRAISPATDVYALGAILYECLTGRPPFRGANNQELLAKAITEKAQTPQLHNPDVTDEFAALVLRMLAKKREDRPRDCGEIIVKLRTIRVFKSDPPPGTKFTDA